MAPLHHHFELSGWPEEKITLRFWIVGALSALIGVAFYLGTRGTLAGDGDRGRRIDLQTLTARHPSMADPWRCSGWPAAASRWLATRTNRGPGDGLRRTPRDRAGGAVAAIGDRRVERCSARTSTRWRCSPDRRWWRPRLPSTAAIPTTEPRLRSALRIWSAGPGAGGQRGGPVPAPVSRRRRSASQERRVRRRQLADRGRAGAGAGACAPGRQHRDSARGATARADRPSPGRAWSFRSCSCRPCPGARDVSVYTHVTSDHVDRHGSVDAYREVKRLLAGLAPTTGALVLNDEDPVTRGWDGGSAARVVRYRRIAPAMGGIGVEDGWGVAWRTPSSPLTADNVAGLDGPVVALDKIPVPGWHSVSNVAAAVAVGALFGLSRRRHPRAVSPASRAWSTVWSRRWDGGRRALRE